MEDADTKIGNEFEQINGYFSKTENGNENATNHLEVSFSGRPNTNAEENGNSDYYQQTNTCRILQRKLELKVEKAKRSYNQYQDICSKKSQSSSLIPISRLQIPGYIENQPLVDYKSESDDQEEISFFPLKLKSTKKQELSDTFSIQEITIESEDNNSDDSDASANLELLPPRLKTNLLDKVLSCFYCVQAVESVILDSRCYLEGGGSAESFLASEDLEVGALIGKLRINGNPDEDLGDINLSLRERDAPVEIVPGSKNIVLAVELDKEGVKGPSSIYVNVICVRRHSTDPSFVIPVNVRVIDVNDNAPQWIGTPYTLTLSEVTVPGTRILQGARAADIDQQGPFSTVEYQVLPGPFSEFVQFLNPLEGTLVLKKPLDYEVMHNFTLKLRAQDQGTPPKFTDTMLRLVITDADDQNPKFLRESYKGELPIDGRPGELKIRPEAIKAVDQDEGICAPIQYSIVQSQDTKYFRIHPNTGVITLLAPIGYSDLVNGATLVVKATQIDNPDRYALTTVTLSRPGTHSDMTTLAFVQKRFFMRVREDMLVGNRILALPTNKPGKHLRYYIPDPVQSQNFNVGSLGEVILQKPLDYEQAMHHDFVVVATDGVANATAEVSLEVIDVNDWEPRFRETHYEFVVPKSSLRSRAESFDGVMIGKIEAADGDRNDKIELSLRGQHAGLFEIDSAGNLFIRPDMLLNESTIHIVAIATDSGVPPRSTSVPITVTMKGVALAQTSWASSILGMFGVLVGIFVLIILVLTCYIIRSKTKTKSAKSRNRVHSQGAVASANLMTRPKVPPHNGLPRVKTTAGGNVTLTNPITNGHGGSGSSLSAGASTILAASLEREAQRERERERQRERDNYAATVRSIVSRASANGQLYDGEMERHSIAIHETVEHNVSENGNKKTAWEPHKSSLLSATEDMGSSENNLTVYF